MGHLQSKSEFAPYYRNSLLYLACIELSDLEPEEQLSRAHDLGLSAFLGDTIYNFGELVSLTWSRLDDDNALTMKRS